MTTLLDDQAVAARVLEHIDKGTTDVGDDLWREPVGNYRSAERFRLEVERVLRRSWTPFCPSAALPDVGSYLARTAAGTPLIAVRGDDGRVRAFRNGCRHRGMEIATGAGCKKAFACPYHGWTYRLDGRLHHVPHEYGFPGLDKDQHGLVPVAAQEHLGLVFVTQGEPSSADQPWHGLLDLIGPGQQILDTREIETEVNWKIYLEGFIEGYHIRPTHRESFYPYGFDNLTLVERSGRNSRVTYPFRRIQKLADVAPQERNVEGLLTYVYHLFPNTLVTVLSRHTNLVILEPVSAERTKLFTYTVTNHSDGGPETNEAERDAKFVNETGGAEDMAIVCAIQRSLDSGANEFFTFGRFEGAIVHFHRCLAAALDSRPSPAVQN
jgi:phenylpropionate dioxygenase-like ring-hydroxylating dioxygenase large terminal subunit